ncbi:sulfotransferase 1B1-like [Haliotis rubra]|uniref:sulfotransferase 1B1-like n=1 Tax=Haliotis rubra TaxID=36100 RepID=UPI001EE5BD97|nr:sulfotransferase 1B1-like [Haliotis rubra]
MALRTDQDNGGNLHKYLDIGGKRFPLVIKEEIVRNIPNIKLREDDVIICGYPRSGTHWTFEMTSMLLTGRDETIPLWKGNMMLSMVPERDLALAPSPRVLNTHQFYEQLPRDIITLRNKIVYVLRDPRDVAVSFYHFYINNKTGVGYHGTWRHFLELFLNGKVQWGSWFEHVKNFEEVIKTNRHGQQILVMNYEDTKQNPKESVNRLSDFLGLPRNDELCSQIADKCSFTNMAVDKLKYTLLSDNRDIMYRKGVVGDWKNMFTVAQSEVFDRLLTHNMAGSELVRRYITKPSS